MIPPTRSPNLCAQAWTYREEVLYPALFGRERRGIMTIPPGMFTETFRQTEVDPTWTWCGIFEYAPKPARASWLYVTSGMSNAWGAETEQTEGPSGLGCEFVLELPARAPWAVTRLSHLMAYQLLLCYGKVPDRQPMKYYDQVPLNTSIGTEESALTWLLLAPPTGFPGRQETRTGWFEFVQIVGISESEAKAGQIHGGPLLVKGLTQEGAFPVTLPERKAIV